jgi:hypothetical protein
MSSQLPPDPNVSTFNNLYWITGDTALTKSQADKLYLKYPNAQGNETLKDINVDNITVSQNKNIIMSGSGHIDQSADNGTSNNTLTNTIVNKILTLQGAYASNAQFNINGWFGSLNGFTIRPDANQSQYLFNITRYNTNDPQTQFKFITTNTTGTQYNLIINPTNVSIPQPIINTAPIPAPNDNSTRVPTTQWVQSAISNISLPFSPKSANYADYQTGTSGYSQGTYLICGGTWGPLDYVMFRITAQANYGNSGSGWTNYATTIGQLIFRPYYAPSGVWANVSCTKAYYTTNSNNSNIGNVQNAIYYSGAVNNGYTDHFFIYGYGGAGNGSPGSYIQLMCEAPGLSGGWAYTHLVEYICHSTTGGTITLQNGYGTNNYLP